MEVPFHQTVLLFQARTFRTLKEPHWIGLHFGSHVLFILKSCGYNNLSLRFHSLKDLKAYRTYDEIHFYK